jgi:hypothetical protein
MTSSPQETPRRSSERGDSADLCRDHATGFELKGEAGGGSAWKALNPNDYTFAEKADVLAECGESKLQGHPAAYNGVELSIKERS